MVTTSTLAYIYYGLSTDTKPTKHVHNGSMFVEINTSKKYFFDEEGKRWIEWGSSANNNSNDTNDDGGEDLSSTLWYFKSTVSASSDASWLVNFNCNDVTYDKIDLSVTNDSVKIEYWKSSPGGETVKTTVYDSSAGGWVNSSYRTIAITDGSSATSISLNDFLRANARQELYVPDEEVTVDPAGGN